MFSFVPDRARPLASRPYLIPSIYLICIFGSLLPQGRARSILVMAALIYLIAQIPKCTSGERASDLFLPIQGTLVLVCWLDFFVLHSPNDFYRLKDKEKPPQTALGRLGWHADLCTAMRGIGWNWKVKNVPEPANPKTTKWAFVRKEALKAIMWYLLFDLCTYPVLESSYHSHNPPDLFSDTIPIQLIFTWLQALGSYYAINLQYSLAVALSVGVGLFKPQNWPPVMGKLRDVLTVRDLWGKFWHQFLRRKLNLPFEILKRYIPIRRGTLTSKYLQLYLAFIASACLHHLGAWNSPDSSGANNWRQATFFLIQPIAISFEDFVIYLGKKAGIKKSWKTKLLGRVWTFAWFTYSLRFIVAFHYGALIMEIPIIPSFFRIVFGPWKLFPTAT